VLLAIVAAIGRPGRAHAAEAAAPASREEAGGSGWLLFFESGAELFDRDGYAIFEPGLEYRGSRLAVALGGPLRIGEATTDGVSHVALRRGDVDEQSDLGGMVRLIAWGQEGEPIRVLAGSVPSFTLGNGAVVGGLRPSVDPDHPRAGALAHFDLGPVALEGLASDVLSPRVFAGRAVLSLGDRLALGATGAVEPEPIRDADAVSAVAADASLVVVRREAWTLAPYVKAAGIASAGGGAGLHAGVAADLRLGPGGDTQIGLRGEWRGIGRGYLPRYFDEFEEVERWAYPGDGAPPKYRWARDAPAGQGFAAEARFDVADGFGASAALEGRQGGPWSAQVGADVRAIPGWSLGLLLARRGAADPGNLADLGEGTWLMAESRVDVGGPFYAFATGAHGFRVPRWEADPKEYAAVSLGIGAAVAP
jgi:hypothetical protein